MNRRAPAIGWHGRAAAPPDRARPCATPFASVALLLQGGGALGAYQAGVYEGLMAAGIAPTWIAGISIGAINSAIIAGNAPEHRVRRLREFWEGVSDGGDAGLADRWAGLWQGETARRWLNQLSAARVAARGVSGFFEPRVVLPGGSATSLYDTSELRPTLERLVDFDRINAGETRFSVGAVNVRTGNFAYFDNETHRIGAEHIMASGALPPAFAPVEVEGELYWDGGLVSNTPLDWVLSARSGLDTLVLQVDLWSARGEAPRDLMEVVVRTKDIQYSSRTRAATDDFGKLQLLLGACDGLLKKLSPELLDTPEARLLLKASDPALYNIVQLVYRAAPYEGQAKDYEFSRRSMEEHWAAGLRDIRHTLAHPEVLTLPTNPEGLAVYDFTAAEPTRSATDGPETAPP